jgi:hypothetical protein
MVQPALPGEVKCRACGDTRLQTNPSELLTELLVARGIEVAAP